MFNYPAWDDLVVPLNTGTSRADGIRRVLAYINHCHTFPAPCPCHGLGSLKDFLERADKEITEHHHKRGESIINKDSITHRHAISSILEIPAEHKKEVKELTDWSYQEGETRRQTQHLYHLFEGLRYPKDDTPIVHSNPFDYFPPGYKKCNCGECLVSIQTVINDANDNSIEWDMDTYPISPLGKQWYKQFCSKVGFDFHPSGCLCDRCKAVEILCDKFMQICPSLAGEFNSKFLNCRKDLTSATKSGLGLTTGMNPIFPFLSHRMLQNVALEELVNASGTSEDLMIRLSIHKKKYDIYEIMTLFDGKTLKAFCKKNLKELKLNKGNKYMITEITTFLNNAQDKAGRRICSDAWTVVLDFLGKSWIDIYI